MIKKIKKLKLNITWEKKNDSPPWYSLPNKRHLIVERKEKSARRIKKRIVVG